MAKKKKNTCAWKLLHDLSSLSGQERAVANSLYLGDVSGTRRIRTRKPERERERKRPLPTYKSQPRPHGHHPGDRLPAPYIPASHGRSVHDYERCSASQHQLRDPAKCACRQRASAALEQRTTGIWTALPDAGWRGLHWHDCPHAGAALGTECRPIGLAIPHPRGCEVLGWLTGDRA